MQETGLEKTKRVNHHSVKKCAFFRDIDGFTQAEKNKIVEWWPYAETYYNNLRRKFPTTPDDVLFDGVEDALIYSIRTWNSEGKASFKTWFHRSCIMAVRRSWRRYRKGYLANDSGDRKIATTGKAKDCDMFLNETMKFGSTQWEDRCLERLAVDEAMSCLKPNEKEVMERMYVYNEKQADIARAMGVTRQRVSFIHKEAIRKCREAAEGGLESDV